MSVDISVKWTDHANGDERLKQYSPAWLVKLYADATACAPAMKLTGAAHHLVLLSSQPYMAYLQ